MRILAKHLEPYLDYGYLQGIPKEELWHPVSLDMHSRRTTITPKDFFRVVSKLKDRIPGDRLGLNIGAYLNLSTVGVVYDISQRVTSNEEAMHYCHDYLKATFPAIDIRYGTKKDSFHVRLKIQDIDSEIEAVILETTLTVMAREIKLFAGADARIILSSPYCTKHYPAPWQKGGSFSISFRQSILKSSLKKSHFVGLDILIRQYLTLLVGLKEDRSWNQKVMATALRLASPDLPGLDEVARLFHLTNRSLQRLLANEGTNFRQIIEGLKKKICELLLRHDGLSMGEISHILGYSEPAAFHHAFKKWSKGTPRSLRANLIRRPSAKRANPGHRKI